MKRPRRRPSRAPRNFAKIRKFPAPPLKPKPALRRVRRRFTRRKSLPAGIAWYGFRSLWGHLRHFVASAIATDGIDARDWMMADPPDQLLRRMVKRLGGNIQAKCLTEALGRDVWLDYLADTGEHPLVTEAVARMVLSRYVLPVLPDRPEEEEPEDRATVAAPRGEVLIFGGDTAYPVATVQEIHDRVTAPFNRAGRSVGGDGETRVLLGIPGNHDWYDGLDGFSRMFRRKRWGEDYDVRPSVESIDEGAIEHAVDFVGSFVAGEERSKIDAVLIHGYRPVQSASYWCLPLAPNIDLWGVDRQLRRIDGQQVEFFRKRRRRRPGAKTWLLLPDPILAFGKPSKTGVDTVERLGLELKEEDSLVFSGDIHHYRREPYGKTTHITAGGGGAFLHPAPIAQTKRNEPVAEWPGRAQSKSILRGAALHVMAGRAGLIPHVVMLLLFAPALGVGGFWGRHAGLVSASMVAAFVTFLIYAALGGVRHPPRAKVTCLAAIAGVSTGLVPALTAFIVNWAEGRFGLQFSTWLSGTLALLLAVLFGGFTFGAYLAALTRFGIEESQAFTALAHPGFKHFIRCRVQADGTVDSWVLGLEDPLAEDAEVVLVDHFRWNAAEDKGSSP